jgi:hypothetical protein
VLALRHHDGPDMLFAHETCNLGKRCPRRDTDHAATAETSYVHAGLRTALLT